MKRFLLVAALLLLVVSFPVQAQVAETACGNAVDDDGDGDVDCDDSDCAPWTPCSTKIKIVIGVDNSIASDLGQLCNWMKDNGGFSANGWGNMTTCPYAVFNSGIRVWASEAAKATAKAHGNTQAASKFNELYSPISAGVALTDPLKRVCGDGFLDTGEACDDGNTVSGDGCQGHCALPYCGDGITDPGETCDDGGSFNNDGCDSTCQIEVSP